MMIWIKVPTVEALTLRGKNSLSDHLGIEFVAVGENSITAKMPVDDRTRQPMGLLHGGASVVLAETLGSIAALHCVNTETHSIVGLEINANHIKSAKSGWVYGEVKPIHIGRSTHIWQIEITNEGGQLMCISRITIAVLQKSQI
jgi:1,4-dihydroxy-2-naphthoyl-CoA hydrolase